MKRPQTKFHVDTMSHSKVIKSKKVKIYHQVITAVFLLVIAIFLKLQQQILICFCKFSGNSEIV